MAKVMATLRLAPDEANLPAVRRKLGLNKGEIDQEFGVVALNPEEHLYAILVDEAIGAKLAELPEVSGPYANPTIAPFGPPR